MQIHLLINQYHDYFFLNFRSKSIRHILVKYYWFVHLFKWMIKVKQIRYRKLQPCYFD
jgi:hypothetical protein